MDKSVLVLRLAGPLQSWGSRSQHNRRETDLLPSKAGVIGLLAAADGRRRNDPIEDLLQISLGVRVDQPGSLLRDFHTVSDLANAPLLSAAVNEKGVQKPTSPKKFTHVTQRYYLQDACFVAALQGSADFVLHLTQAMCRPAFPLALGRRSCVPSQPLVVRNDAEESLVWQGDLLEVLSKVPWQANAFYQKKRGNQQPVRLPIMYDNPTGEDTRADVPVSFEPDQRNFASRRVSTGWVDAIWPVGSSETTGHTHDAFELLGDSYAVPV